jgi:uncharacterized protein (TIGR02599 family)
MNAPKSPTSIRPSPSAFTLVELLLAVTILTVILLALTSIMGQTTRAWSNARSQLQQFREAELAFEQMTRRITDALLNTYHDYEFPDNNKQKTPTRYVRQSEMHFVTGPANSTSADIPPLLDNHAPPSHAIFFQGPFGEHDDTNLTGLNTLLNAWGYFIEFGADENERPSFLNGSPGATPRYRFRLKEFRQSSENLSIYQTSLSELASPTQLYHWFTAATTSPQVVHTLAENIIALVIRPLAPGSPTLDPTAIAPHYYYDSRAYQRNAGSQFTQNRSRHQLPPMLEITLVVLDESSAARLQQQHGSTRPDLGIDHLFLDTSTYAADLADLEETLLARKLQFRILKKTVRLRNARWSDID